MKYLLSIIVFLILSQLEFANTQQKQHVHQYIVVEAYKLLKAQLGYDIPRMKDHVGTTETGYGRFLPGGLMVIGAFREDEEDIVYGYGAPFGWNVSSTHFGDPDRGDGSHFKSVPLNIVYPNAYEKANKFIYGGYKIQIAYPGTPIIEEYEAPADLPNYYKTGTIFYRGYYNEIGKFISRNIWVTSSQSLRDRITWEILGRVAHLLGDMGCPAHAHNTQHDPVFGGLDTYEEEMGSAYLNWNYQDALAQESAWGGRIDVTTKSNPIKYLFYTTAQIAGHFPSDHDTGNNVWDINEPFSLYPPLDNIMTILGPPPTSVNVTDIASKSYVYSIRATAALFYWFAKEAGILSPPPLSSVWISGTQDLNDRYIIFAKWTSYVSGGIAPFHYQWKKLYTGINSFVGNDVWFPIGTDSRTLTMSRPFNYFGDFKLKCIVTDAANSTVTSNIIDVRGLRRPYEAALDNKNLVPTKTKLDKNYPNPFNPSTTIKYQLKKPGFVSLKVYDILGKEVANLVNENKSAGFYNVSFDASKLSSGLYIYRLRVNDFVKNMKMLLTK